MLSGEEFFYCLAHRFESEKLWHHFVERHPKNFGSIVGSLRCGQGFKLYGKKGVGGVHVELAVAISV